MTYRELPMIDVKEALRRWQAGHSNRRIARETGIDRDTLLVNGPHDLSLGPELRRELASADQVDVLFVPPRAASR
jgi:hypothetical protein